MSQQSSDRPDNGASVSARPKVALLTGGSTPERTVALAGARQVTKALRQRGYSVTVFDTCSGRVETQDEESLLPESVDSRSLSPEQLEELEASEDLVALIAGAELQSADVVWPLLHGLQGEGGEVQSVLEAAGLPYVGSDARGSTLAMDKSVAKILMMSVGVPTPQWVSFRAGDVLPQPTSYPLVVKPSRVGSTVGLSLIDDQSGLESAIEQALLYDDEVLLEEFLAGRELTVGIFRDQALAVGESRTKGQVFDYHSKYQAGAAQEIFPAEIPRELAQHVQALALKVHQVLKLRDFSRVDFRLDASGSPKCLEANTLPGMTKTSLLPQSAAAAGIGFGDLCSLIVELALERIRG